MAKKKKEPPSVEHRLYMAAFKTMAHQPPSAESRRQLRKYWREAEQRIAIITALLDRK